WPFLPNTKRYAPPTRGSVVHSKSSTPSERGAHQRRRSSAFVIASNTIDGRARNVRRRTSSRSDARSTWVANSFVSTAFMASLFLVPVAPEIAERVDSLPPNLPVGAEPIVHPA